MTTYERVRFEGRTVILRDVAEVTFAGEPAITGIEVNAYGEEVVTGGVTERRRIIATSIVTKRTVMVWDRHYGELRRER